MHDSAKNVLIVVTADPRESGRTAEAVRIAAGVGGWEKVSVKLCLCGEARAVLAETVDELVNGEAIEAYLPLLLEGAKVHQLVDDGGTTLDRPRVKAVTLSQLAALSREADSVLRF